MVILSYNILLNYELLLFLFLFACPTLIVWVFSSSFNARLQIKLLPQFANIKDDGTVQLEVPGDIKPPSLDLVKVVQDESTDEEPFDTAEPQDIPPLQIVMLIVGTRGDVQPFIAIGKRLQVTFVLWFYKFSK